MALELAIGALKMLYQLAKMIKEAKQNCEIVRDKIISTQSMETILNKLYQSLIADGCHESLVLKEIEARMVAQMRISRRMRLKYEPLINLLSNLGGSSAMLKAQASMIRRGMYASTMALSTLSSMMRNHMIRTEKRAREAYERAKLRIENTTADMANYKEKIAATGAKLKDAAGHMKDKAKAKADALQQQAMDKVKNRSFTFFHFSV